MGEDGRRDLGGPLGRQDETESELAALAGDPLENPRAGPTRWRSSFSGEVAVNEGVCLLQHQSGGQLLSFVPPVTLDRLEDHAGQDADDDVDHLGGHEGEVDDSDRAVRCLIGANVVGEPVFQGDGGGIPGLEDGGQASPREEPADAEVQGVDELGGVPTGLAGGESINEVRQLRLFVANTGKTPATNV